MPFGAGGIRRQSYKTAMDIWGNRAISQCDFSYTPNITVSASGAITLIRDRVVKGSATYTTVGTNATLVTGYSNNMMARFAGAGYTASNLSVAVSSDWLVGVVVNNTDTTGCAADCGSGRLAQNMASSISFINTLNFTGVIRPQCLIYEYRAGLSNVYRNGLKIASSTYGTQVQYSGTITIGMSTSSTLPFGGDYGERVVIQNPGPNDWYNMDVWLRGKWDLL